MHSERSVQSWNGQHIDALLNGMGLFRKHMIRDSSSLFRAIAEVVYHSQALHKQIREQCADFTLKYGQKYIIFIDGKEIDDRASTLYHEETSGDMTDVDTLGILFRRDIIVFDMHGRSDITNVRNYGNPIYLLYQRSIKHFDLLLPMERVRTAAYCQSLAYKAIYQGVFSMTDVDYATNVMLSDSTFDNSFGFVDSYQNEISQKYTKSFEFYSQNSYFESVSAREILFNNLIPFPYKVARGLSPFIYKNFEYDVWSEYKKEKESMVGQCLKVGLKCLCRMERDQKTPYVCYIQDIRDDSNQCIVYIEELGEKVLVKIDQLQSLPFDEAKQWQFMSNKKGKFRRGIKNKKVQEVAKYIQNRSKVVFKTRIIEKNQSAIESEKDSNNNEVNDWEVYKKTQKIQSYSKMSYSTFKPCVVDFVAMPFTVEHSSNGVNNGAAQETAAPPNRPNNSAVNSNGNNYTYVQFSPSPVSTNLETSTPPTSFMAPNPSVLFQAPIGAASPYSSPSYQQMFCMPSMQPLRPAGPIGVPYHPIPRSSLGGINYSAHRSLEVNGSDLPQDVATLRYFFNLGVEWAQSGCLSWSHHGPPPPIGPLHTLPPPSAYPPPSFNQIVMDMQNNLVLDDIPRNHQECSPKEQQKSSTSNGNTQFKNTKYNNDFRNGRGGGPGGRFRRNDNNYHQNKNNGNNRGNGSKKTNTNNTKSDERNLEKKEQEHEPLSNSRSVTPSLPMSFPPPTYYRYPENMIPQNYAANFVPYNPAPEEGIASPGTDGNFIAPVNLPPPPFVYYAPQQPVFIPQNLPQNTNYAPPNNYTSQTPDNNGSK